MAAHYELLTYTQSDDEGIEIPGSMIWKIKKNGIELPITYTNHQEAIEAFNAYLNAFDFPDAN